MTTETQETEALRRLAERHEELRTACFCVDEESIQEMRETVGRIGRCAPCELFCFGSTLLRPYSHSPECSECPGGQGFLPLPLGTLAQRQRAEGALMGLLVHLEGSVKAYQGRDSFGVVIPNLYCILIEWYSLRRDTFIKAFSLVLALARALEAQEEKP